jgi:hypothetical protein
MSGYLIGSLLRPKLVSGDADQRRRTGSYGEVSMKIDAATLRTRLADPDRRIGYISTGFKVLRFLGFACLLSASVAWASAASGIYPDGEDGSRAPAQSRAIRLSNVEGQVRVVQDGQVIADPAFTNLPLFEGSEIATGNDGRAEIQLEDGSIARLSPNTTLVFSVLQQDGSGTRTEVVLKNGLAYFELQPSTAEHRLRVNYGQAFFTARNFSVVRLTNDAPPAEVAVFTGSVHLGRSGAQQDPLQLDIHEGESVTLDASDPSRSNLSETIQTDSWDSWNSDRDQLLNSQSADRTAATNNLKNYPGDGMSDLDANGSWYNIPGQGYIWSPYDAQSAGSGWDPYGYGNWVSYPQYGYVWVSGYSWGYTPFQCGMWDYFDNFGWGWAPGTGCNPWWGGDGYYGGGGWGFRLGNNFPPGYHPPHRPVHPVPRPHPGPGHPLETSHRGPSVPIIAVDHRPSGTGDRPLPGRTNSPVVIAGQAVEPLRPLAPRQAYIHPGEGYVNRAAPIPASAYQGLSRPGSPAAPARPVSQYGSGSSPRSYSPPPSRPEPVHVSPPSGGGGSAPHSSPPPAPHK